MSSVSVLIRQARPILSRNHEDARRRVLALYRAYLQQITFIVDEYDIPRSQQECRQKIREEFERHAHVTDVRIIDRLVMKGQMDLMEMSHGYWTKTAIMGFFKDTWEPKPKDFMSKFLAGQE